MIPHAMRVLKMFILSRLEIFKVRTTLGTLWLHKLLPAEQAQFGNLAGLAGRSLYSPSMSDFLGFQTKYIWNP